MSIQRTNGAQSSTPIANVDHGGAQTAAAAQDVELMPQCKQLAASGDIGAMISAMLLEAAHQQRETARKERDAAMNAEDAADAAELQHMEEAADAKFTSGLVGGATTAIGGLATIGSAFTDDKASKIIGGSAGAEKGAGQGVSAFFGRAADEADRDARHSGQVAKRAGDRVSAAQDDDKDAREATSRALDLYKEYLQAKNDAQKAALFRA